jgi:hypothetical protein
MQPVAKVNGPQVFAKVKMTRTGHIAVRKTILRVHPNKSAMLAEQRACMLQWFTEGHDEGAVGSQFF